MVSKFVEIHMFSHFGLFGMLSAVQNSCRIEMVLESNASNVKNILSENTFLCDMVIFNKTFIKAFFVFSEDE